MALDTKRPVDTSAIGRSCTKAKARSLANAVSGLTSNCAIIIPVAW